MHSIPQTVALVAAWVIIGAGYLLLRNAAMAGLPAGRDLRYRTPHRQQSGTLPELFTGLVIPLGYSGPCLRLRYCQPLPGSCAVAAINNHSWHPGQARQADGAFGSALVLSLCPIAGMMYRQGNSAGMPSNYLNHRSIISPIGRNLDRVDPSKPCVTFRGLFSRKMLCCCRKRDNCGADPACASSICFFCRSGRVV